jgi:hypothetical protein
MAKDRSAYQRQYFQLNKTRIVEKRRLHRLAMTETDREKKRADAQQYTAKRRAKIVEWIENHCARRPS